MSANPVKGEAVFTVDGTAWTMRFTFDALVQIETRFGKRIVRVFSELMASEDGPPLADLRFIVWQSLRHHHPELTEEATGDMMLGAMRDRSMVGMLEAAVLAAFPPPGDAPANPRTPPTGIGPH